MFPFCWSTAYIHEAARIREAALIIGSQPCKAMRCAALNAGGGMVPVRHPDALAKWRILGLGMEQLAYRVIGCLRLILHAH